MKQFLIIVTAALFIVFVGACQPPSTRKDGLSFDNYNLGLTSLSSDQSGRWSYRIAAKDDKLLVGITCSGFIEEFFEFSWTGKIIRFRVNSARTHNPRMGDYSARLADDYLEIVPGGACDYVRFDFKKKLSVALRNQRNVDPQNKVAETKIKKRIEEEKLAVAQEKRKLEEYRLAELADRRKREEDRVSRLVEEKIKLEAEEKKKKDAVNIKAALKKARWAEFVEGRKHDIAVIIGNKIYPRGVPDIDFAHNDADEMKRFVIDQLGFREGNVVDLRDTTRAQLVAVFGNETSHKAKLNNWVRPDKSNVVVFYSGHGVPGLKDRRGYLLPVDADPNLVELNGYAVDTLYANLNKIPAKSITVYLDACFSGDSPKGMIVRAASGISVEAVVPKQIGKLIVLTAAQGDQFASWDEDAKLGLFTRYLLKALRGAADGVGYGNGDGQVTVAEVERYLTEEMTYQARRLFNRDQNPTVQGDPNYVLSMF